MAAINFLVIGVAISGGNPRVGRSANLVFAMFAFVLYYNLLGLGQSWISSGRYDLIPLMLTLHGGTFALAILWLGKAHNNWNWRRLLPKQRASNQDGTAS
jgi:lipopolysaccharide export system permease protein